MKAPGFQFLWWLKSIAFGMFLRYIVLAAAFLFIMSALLMWLWNITITRIFNIRKITYWEAFRLLIIAGIIFGKGFSFNMNF